MSLANLAPRMTPEWKSVLDFVNNMDDTDPHHWIDRIPYCSTSIRRVPSSSTDLMLEALNESSPLLIQDAIVSWPSLRRWSFSELAERCGDMNVIANDRAPARHADVLPNGGGKQRSVSLRLRDFVEYVNCLPSSLEALPRHELYEQTPFYVNGWRAFAEGPKSLGEDCPTPQFVKTIDHTVLLLKAINTQLFGSSTAAGTAGDAWCRNVDINLTKLFMGPPGTITRLHYDAGDAHGWLAQIKGRKLFILVPPEAIDVLHPLPTEKETVQSGLDPLHPDVEKWPGYPEAGAVACILEPGEAVLIPKGWWHWAVAIDASITYQRNFYSSPSNARGLVNMVLQTAAHLKSKSK